MERDVRGPRISPPHRLDLIVPGSTSNLGPGFDVLGLAVDRALTVAWEPGDAPLEVVRRGTLAGMRIPVAEDLVVRSLCAGLERWLEGGEAVRPGRLGGRLVLASRIPVARGLGSSAAARVGGLLLATALAPSPPDPDRVLALAASGEGHPDNVAPSLRGGLVATGWDGAGDAGGEVRVVRLPLSPRVGWAYAAPGAVVRTDEARAALPATVPHARIGETGARLAVLLHGLATGDGDAVRWGIADRVHSPWRLGLVPGGAAAVAAATAAGAWGATLSGSGSGIIALGPPDAMAEVRDAMAGAFDGHGDDGDAHAFLVRPDPRGARWEREGS
jgi:homoserine kinase